MEYFDLRFVCVLQPCSLTMPRIIMWRFCITVPRSVWTSNTVAIRYNIFVLLVDIMLWPWKMAITHKEPTNCHGARGDRTHDVQAEERSPAASCPAYSFHIADTVSIHSSNARAEAALDDWQPVWMIGCLFQHQCVTTHDVQTGVPSPDANYWDYLSLCSNHSYRGRYDVIVQKYGEQITIVSMLLDNITFKRIASEVSKGRNCFAPKPTFHELVWRNWLIGQYAYFAMKRKNIFFSRTNETKKEKKNYNWAISQNYTPIAIP